jgi:hypothetical protein
MPCNKSALFEFLEVLSEELTKRISLIAVGGTAMTLLDLKPSTIDIDFTIPEEDLREFARVLKNNPPGIRVDYWANGYVFCQYLPDDYLEKSVKIKEFKHISLRAIQPVDIIVTKIGRLDGRDIQDIGDCVRKSNVSEAEIKARASLVIPTYFGREGDYLHNLDVVVEKFFKK